MRAFLAAMVAMIVIAAGANWALEEGPLSGILAEPDQSVRLGE